MSLLIGHLVQGPRMHKVVYTCMYVYCVLLSYIMYIIFYELHTDIFVPALEILLIDDARILTQYTHGKPLYIEEHVHMHIHMLQVKTSMLRVATISPYCPTA